METFLIALLCVALVGWLIYWFIDHATLAEPIRTIVILIVLLLLAYALLHFLPGGVMHGRLR